MIFDVSFHRKRRGIEPRPVGLPSERESLLLQVGGDPARFVGLGLDALRNFQRGGESHKGSVAVLNCESVGDGDDGRCHFFDWLVVRRC